MRDLINNTIALICGVQGAGKTTAARMLAPNANYSADDYGQYVDILTALKVR